MYLLHFVFDIYKSIKVNPDVALHIKNDPSSFHTVRPTVYKLQTGIRLVLGIV